MNILQKMRTHGKVNAAQEKPVHPYKIVYVERDGAQALPGQHVVQARSQYEAWSLAMNLFEQKFPDKDFDKVELMVEEMDS